MSAEDEKFSVTMVEFEKDSSSSDKMETLKAWTAVVAASVTTFVVSYQLGKKSMQYFLKHHPATKDVYAQYNNTDS